jgi:hypothetical protein
VEFALVTFTVPLEPPFKPRAVSPATLTSPPLAVIVPVPLRPRIRSYVAPVPVTLNVPLGKLSVPLEKGSLPNVAYTVLSCCRLFVSTAVLVPDPVRPMISPRPVSVVTVLSIVSVLLVEPVKFSGLVATIRRSTV